VGKLKIGELKENAQGKTYPSKLDWIKAVDGAGNRVTSFHMVYGDKPKEFMAMFHSNDPKDFFWEAYRRYGSGTGLACHGDGHCAIIEATGETIKCPCQHAQPTVKNDKEYPPACKVTQSVLLWLYEVPELGLFQIDTSGFRSMSNLKWFITEGLPSLSGGQIAGIPIRVLIEPFQAVHDGKQSLAYQWKFALAPDMKPADVRAAALSAVEGFVIPGFAARQQIDESKPEELYAGIPAHTGEPIEDNEPSVAVAPGDVQVVDDEIGERVLAAEQRLDAALKAVAMPANKIAALETAREKKQAKAMETGDWVGYEKWLTQNATALEGRSGQGGLL
jgi:hypothetical protein